MARAIDNKMFTRDVAMTRVSVKCIDSDDNITVQPFVLPFETNDTSIALKYCKKQYETDERTLIKVVSLEIEHKMYGCTLAEFLTVAHELDPDTRKPLD